MNPSSARLREQLARLPAETRELLAQHRFDVEAFLSRATRLAASTLPDNRVVGEVLPPTEGDIAQPPAPRTAEYDELERLGRDALRRGKVALVVLAGGMATRLGGVVKALVEALPGHSFLDLRLAEQSAVERRTGARPPLWFMTSHATDRGVRDALAARMPGQDARVFRQRLSLRLMPDGGLFLDAEGRPSLYAPGHGDVVDALRDSGLLGSFVKAGGETVVVTNLDNLGGTLDEAILGFHLAQVGEGAKVTSEVVDRSDADRGGLPVRFRGRLQVLEELRLPANFDVSRVPVFNINNFYFDAASLLDLRPEWTYFAVAKKVDSAPVIQFERFINQVAEWLPTRFLHVPRLGPSSRFLPVKDGGELLAQRAHIETVARARGMIP
jgi:UTP--glucose-1-phosphate uridylyltransferase